MRKSFLLLIPLLLCACLFDRNPRPGIYDPIGPIYWGGVISLTNDHYISPSDLLIIQRNTLINVDRPKRLILLIEGGLKVKGISSQPVKFSSTTTGTLTVILAGTKTDNSIEYCNFGENDLAVSSDGLSMLYSTIKSVRLLGETKTFLSNCRIGQMFCEESSKPIIRRCEFDRSLFTTLPRTGYQKNIDVRDLSSPVFSENNIMGNTLTTPMNDTIAFIYSSATVDIRNNWWGTNDDTFVTNTLTYISPTSLTFIKPVATTTFLLTLP